MVKVCPICGSYKIGLIGVKRYFCAECCHEFIWSDKRHEAFYPGENGDIRKAGQLAEVSKRHAVLTSA